LNAAADSGDPGAGNPLASTIPWNYEAGAMTVPVSSSRGAVGPRVNPLESGRHPSLRGPAPRLRASAWPIPAAALLGFAVILAACRPAEPPPFNAAVERPLVEQAIRDCIAWAKNKDIDRLYRVIAADAGYLEVSPEGRVTRGIQEFKKAEKFWMSPDFRAIRYAIRDLQISFSRSGEVAWFFCMLDDINEWKGQPANWENTRWTGTLEKRDGQWVMVQMHFSFAAK
jgi:ketosteroid isomerase-like protein